MASQQKEKKLLMDGDQDLFQQHFLKLVNNPEHSDVKFVIGETKKVFYGHRCILAARSDQFKSMFEINTDDGFSMPDMNADVFLLVLQFVYTNSCMVSHDNVLQLLSAAMEYGMKDLVNLCENFIIKTISVDTVCDAIQVAVTFGLDEFKRNLLSYIEEHTEDVFASQTFNEMSDETLAYILQSDELRINEIDVIHAVKGWAVINSLATNKPLYEVARLVVCNLRLPLLSSEQLTQVESENAKERFIPVEQISVAWRHLALKTPLNSSLDTTPRHGTILNER